MGSAWFAFTMGMYIALVARYYKHPPWEMYTMCLVVGTIIHFYLYG